MQWLKLQFSRGVLLLLLGIVCWYGALGAWALHNQQWNRHRVSYREPDSRLDFGSLKELRRQIALEGEGEVTGWGQSLSEEIRAGATSGVTRVDVIWLDGNASLIWALPQAEGQFPGPKDTIGCAIDSKTALKLFGSMNVIGKEVQIAGEQMTIRGVFTLPEGISAVSSDPGRGLAFCPAALAKESVRMTALEFIPRPGPGETAKEQAEKWMNAAAMGAGGSMDDHRDTQELMALFTSLPGFLFMGLMLAELYLMFIALTKAIWLRWITLVGDRSVSRRQLISPVILWCALTLALVITGVWAARLPAFGASIPASFLPTRWSDFSFWPKKAEQLLQLHVRERLSPALRPDLAERGLLTAGILLSLLSPLLLWPARNALKRGIAQAGTGSISACAGALTMAAPLSLWLVRRVGWIPALLPGMAYLPVAFFAVLAAPRLIRQSEKVQAWLFGTAAGGMTM